MKGDLAIFYVVLPFFVVGNWLHESIWTWDSCFKMWFESRTFLLNKAGP